MRSIDNFYFKIKHFAWIYIPRLMKFLHHHRSIAKFYLSGCVSGGLDLILLFIFYDLLHFEIVRATSVSFILCFAISFFLQKTWTFRNRSNRRVVRQMAMYFAIGFLNLNLNGFLMHLLVNRFEIWYILAQLGVNLLLGGGNYLFSRFIIFRKQNEI